MRILLVNPNSSAIVTETLRAATVPLQTEKLQIDVVHCSNVPKAIVTSHDELKAGLSVTDLLIREEPNFDAAIIGCFADPGLRAARELIRKPVVGLYESSAIFARLSGRRYSIIASGDESDISPWIGSVRDLGDTENLASIRYINSTVEDSVTASDERIYQIIDQCRKQDGADAVILGCAAFAGKGKRLSEAAGIPVIDGICESVQMAEMMVSYRRKQQ
ncbi:aspartate/glutamate racemase family protein [Anaerovoracaceae bacterium 41-7]|uniref:aspartate/glutamate racemase family protein n=1 Tax=Emergencia sp. JLR.KK010 TaxID=3114296 RepID=UPI0030CC1CC3